MTLREQIIFNSLLNQSDDLKKVDPLDVVTIQIVDDILIWWKDPKDSYKLKLVRATVLPSTDDFISDTLKEYRETTINQLVS